MQAKKLISVVVPSWTDHLKTDRLNKAIRHIDERAIALQSVPMKRLQFYFAAFAICLCSSPVNVHANCGVPEIHSTGEYFQSDLVFIGTVVSAHYDTAAGGGYRVRVHRVFRGPIRMYFDVSTYSFDTRLPLDSGRTYLLFSTIGARGYEIDSCGNSELLSKSGKSVREIERLLHARPYGVIEGWVVSGEDGTDVSGMRVTVKGGPRDYWATTDKDGWFHFRAPIGTYKLDFSSGEYHLNELDDFRYDPHGFVLHAGETASLQVVSSHRLVK